MSRDDHNENSTAPLLSEQDRDTAMSITDQAPAPGPSMTMDAVTFTFDGLPALTTTRERLHRADLTGSLLQLSVECQHEDEADIPLGHTALTAEGFQALRRYLFLTQTHDATDIDLTFPELETLGQTFRAYRGVSLLLVPTLEDALVNHACGFWEVRGSTAGLTLADFVPMLANLLTSDKGSTQLGLELELVGDRLFYAGFAPALYRKLTVVREIVSTRMYSPRCSQTVHAVLTVGGGLWLYEDNAQNHLSCGDQRRALLRSAEHGGVEELVYNNGAVAARMRSGAIVAWGNACSGGDSSLIEEAVRRGGGARRLVASAYAFGVLTRSGDAILWGDVESVNNITQRPTEGERIVVCSNVTQLVANSFAFAALAVRRGRSRVCVWGKETHGRDFGDNKQHLLAGVQSLYAIRDGGFIALKTDNTAVTWGRLACGGGQVIPDVRMLCCKDDGFVAVQRKGRVVFGGQVHGISNLEGKRDGVWHIYEALEDPTRGGIRQIVSTRRKFAALMKDGSVITWGYKHKHWKSRGAAEWAKLAGGVQNLHSTKNSFAAVLHDGGRVITWGSELYYKGPYIQELKDGRGLVLAGSEYFVSQGHDVSAHAVCWGSGLLGHESRVNTLLMTEGFRF